MNTKKNISVIIPTIGRESIVIALQSILSQTYAVKEIIISYDGDSLAEFYELIRNNFFELLDSNIIRIINVGPYSGGNVARQKGIEASCCDYIALLDDDDFWLDDHIEDLVINIEDTDRLYLIACGAYIKEKNNNIKSLPKRMINPHESICEYLFKVNNVILNCGFLQSSLILFSKRLALEIPFDITLKYHQDIDWFMRLEKSKLNFVFIQSGKKTVVYNSTPLSVSKKITAKQSSEWAIKVFTHQQKRCLGDFILTQSYHYAKQNGKFNDEIKMIYNSFYYGRPGFFAVFRVVLKLLRIEKMISIINKIRHRIMKAE